MKRYKIVLLVISYFVVAGIVFFGVWYFYKNHPRIVTETRTETKYVLPSTPPCHYSNLTRDSIRNGVNEYRLQNNLNTLYISRDLDKYAQSRAEEMDKNGKVSHDTQYIGYFQWQKDHPKTDLVTIKAVSEDLTFALNGCAVIQGFKDSPVHNATFINPEYNIIGIGVSDNYVAIELGKY